MKKLFIASLIVLTNNVWCMDQPADQKESPNHVLSFIIEKEIRNKHLLNSFNRDSDIAKEIKNFSLVNKSWFTFFNAPDTTRTIISKASFEFCNEYRKCVAESLKHIAANNYIIQSQKLYENIATLTENEIKDLITAGADVNYKIHNMAMPIFHMELDCTKLELLINLGTDLNKALIDDKFTPLEYFILGQQIDHIKLFIKHKPHKKGLVCAIQTRKKEIIDLVLQQTDIPIEEIQQARATADKIDDPQLKTFFMNLLNNYSRQYIRPKSGVKRYTTKQKKALRSKTLPSSCSKS